MSSLYALQNAHGANILTCEITLRPTSACKILSGSVKVCGSYSQGTKHAKSKPDFQQNLHLKQQSSLSTARICDFVCVSLCLTVVHNTAQNTSDNFSFYYYYLFITPNGSTYKIYKSIYKKHTIHSIKENYKLGLQFIHCYEKNRCVHKMSP